jgi:hypothetical protein
MLYVYVYYSLLRFNNTITISLFPLNNGTIIKGSKLFYFGILAFFFQVFASNFQQQNCVDSSYFFVILHVMICDDM